MQACWPDSFSAYEFAGLPALSFVKNIRTHLLKLIQAVRKYSF
jgi:hypothetical protein